MVKQLNQPAPLMRVNEPMSYYQLNQPMPSIIVHQPPLPVRTQVLSPLFANIIMAPQLQRVQRSSPTGGPVRLKVWVTVEPPYPH